MQLVPVKDYLVLWLENLKLIDLAKNFLNSPQGRIEFKNVNFRYPMRDISVLKDVSIVVEPGTSLGLVGRSGSGKSTIFGLLTRLYELSSTGEGRITLDGVDIADLDINWLRNQIGMVPQNPVLFATTIEENISYGHPGASRTQIEEAAKLANAHQFIVGLPDGYKTIAGERGSQISGGQAQRIALARAFLKSPKILLLDEATSALDSESESLVQEALNRLMVGRTTIVITHKYKTISTLDKLIVMEQGEVIEEGNHHSLQLRGGLYSELLSSSLNSM